jgi:WD40 repeat protein
LEEHRSCIFCVDVLPNGNIVTTSADNTVKVWDKNTKKSVFTLEGHTDLIRYLKVIREKDVLTGSHDGTVKVWDTYTGQCMVTLEVGGPIYCLEVVRIDDGDDRLITGSIGNTVKTWNVETGICLQTITENHDFTILHYGGVKTFPTHSIPYFRRAVRRPTHQAVMGDNCHTKNNRVVPFESAKTFTSGNIPYSHITVL